MFLDVSVNGSHVLVGVCYKPPNIGHLIDFEHTLINLMARYSHVFIMGDLNSNLIKPATYDQTYLTTMLQSYNLTLLPLQATHHTATTNTWLDITAVSDPTHVAYHGKLPAP
uniref:Endonuclease/exonuclease/phosphatase domain-containing protein n=1 Tax=Homalodisca liturata TaxID=320908 RepID=A0A1B6JPP7_9HEMI